MPTSFGMNDSVISLICVAAWNTPTSTPIRSAATRSGAASNIVISSARWPMVMMTSGVTWNLLCVEARRQRAHHESPSIDQHEQHELERQRDQDRREHHHAHRHEHARDDEVDDHERDEDEEADLECGLELARGE